jgi:hypothetical protein
LTRLFQLRKLPDLAAELPVINDKLLKLSKSNIGPLLGEFCQEQLFKKCMIILREDMREETGTALLDKLSNVWIQFYTSILPTLQAFFAPIQLKGLSIRALALLSFRDIVVLKTSIRDAVQDAPVISSEIKQMLLVLQSVHKTPHTEQFYELQSLVSKVIHPYLCMELNSDLGDKNSDSPVKRHQSLSAMADIKPSPSSSVKSLPFDPER